MLCIWYRIYKIICIIIMENWVFIIMYIMIAMLYLVLICGLIYISISEDKYYLLSLIFIVPILIIFITTIIVKYPIL